MTVNKVGRINRDNDLPIHIWFGPYRLLTWNDVWFFNVRCSNPGYHWKYNWNEPSHVVVVGWLDTIRIFFTLLKDRVWKEKNRDTFFKDISYYFTRFFLVIWLIGDSRWWMNAEWKNNWLQWLCFFSTIAPFIRSARVILFKQ